MSDIWKDPGVKAALKDGRQPNDIAVLECPGCGRFGYYNQGSHFYCRKCRGGWYVASEDEEASFDGRPFIRVDHVTTLDDLSDYDAQDVP